MTPDSTRNPLPGPKIGAIDASDIPSIGTQISRLAAAAPHVAAKSEAEQLAETKVIGQMHPDSEDSQQVNLDSPIPR